MNKFLKIIIAIIFLVSAKIYCSEPKIVNEKLKEGENLQQLAKDEQEVVSCTAKVSTFDAIIDHKENKHVPANSPRFTVRDIARLYHDPMKDNPVGFIRRTERTTSLGAKMISFVQKIDEEGAVLGADFVAPDHYDAYEIEGRGWLNFRHHDDKAIFKKLEYQWEEQEKIPESQRSS